MTALAPSAISLAGPSQPPSQSSSPASPTASFSAAQQAAAKSVQAHFRAGSSRPSTPVGGGGSINGSNSNTNGNGNASTAGPSLEPPQNVPYTEFLKSWSDAHVARWLSALDPHGKCAAHAHAFRTADIRGGVLLDLDQASLREIGVTSIGDRIRILNAVKTLRARCSTRAGGAGLLGHAQGASVSSLASSSGSGSGSAGHHAHSSPKVTVNGAEHVDFPRTHSPHAQQQQQQLQQQHAHHASRNRVRPAPLQLRSAAQADLPRLIRDPAPPPDSARSTTPLRPLPLPNSQFPTSAVSTPLQTHSSSGSGSSRQYLPPLPPPPRTVPPLPPTNGTPSRGQPPRLHAIATQQAAGRRTPTQTDAPPPPHYALPPVPGSSSQPQNQNQPPPMQLQLQTQTPTQAQNLALLTPGASTAGSNASTPGNWKGEYGLPSGPRSGGAGTRATSPLPNYGRRSPANAHTHAKAPSFSASASATQVKSAPRPNTSGGHPYANAGASGSGSNAGANSGAGSTSGSGSGAGAGSLQPPSQQALSLSLSPIAESFLNQPLGTPALSPPTAGTSSSSTSLSGPGSASGSNSGSGPGSSAAASAYHVGRGPFRPATPSSAPSLVDLRRRLVRFLLAEDGHSAKVDVAECANGVELFERVLRKFNKLNAPAGESGELVSSDEGGLSIDGWAVYLELGKDGPAKPLREAELLSLCSAGPDHPVREHGLTIRRTGKPRRMKALQQIFGDVSPNSPHSPGVSALTADDDSTHFGNSSVQFPRALTPSQEKELRNMKRASSISVLSGLGVRDPERVLDPSSLSLERDRDREWDRDRERDKDRDPPAPAVNGKSPSASSFAGKIRTFLGQRPPSELIATHLPAYFPYTQPKVLRRTVRQSMRFSSVGAGKRDSTISVLQPGKRASRRVSTATRASVSPNRASMASLPPPPVPEKSGSGSSTQSIEEPPRMSLSTSDGQSVDIGSEDEEKEEKITTPHLLPPVTFPSESFADSFHSVTGTGSGSVLGPGASAASGARSGSTPTISRTTSNASRRISYMSELRARRDRSDTASMLTVDEITAEVENRRKSTVASLKSTESSEATEGLPVNEEPEELEEDDEKFEMIEGEDEIEEEEEDELEDDEDEDLEEDDEEETLAEEDDDAPVKATGGKRGTKWIRGALIGAGSFGSVYLGMDAMNGLLMAVKQVELPTGTGPNEQRKKSMLDALEREIDLLRELQHENIVQYLDSSSDDKHLNIFLEYVPGGSVTALLRNYGAFEEALCRHFVRQILQGLNYLHQVDIIHRDIKGANILVDNKGGIKISDFGISKKVEETFLGSGARAHRPSLQGSVYWMAPEVVKQVAYTRKADIWSVGCLVVEMLTGNHPYPTLNQMQAIFKIGSSAKPTIPSDISPEAEDFLQKTFEVKYEERPDADELLQHPWIVKGPSPTSTTTSSKPASTKTKTAKSS